MKRHGTPDGVPDGSAGTGTGAPADGTHKPARRRRPEPTPVQRALVLLTRREHSGRELTRKLVARGVSKDDAEAAVARLAGEGWQDDARFAESLVRSRAGSGYGPIRIRAELGMHGLDADAVAAAMDPFESDWVTNARDLVERRFGAVATGERTLQRKAADLLLRHGFTGTQIRVAIGLDVADD